MSVFNPEKLSVEFKDEATATQPIIPRRYTLTHSDISGELFLNIGTAFAWEKLNILRDEALGEWIICGNTLKFIVYLYLDSGEVDPSVSMRRLEIFRRELPLALTAIRYGDRLLFEEYPLLNQSPIIVNFSSAYPELARIEMWGTFQEFVAEDTKTK